MEIINRLKASSDLAHKINELFMNSRDKMESDFCNGTGIQISHEKTVVFLLRKLLKDDFKNIEYFIYELNIVFLEPK